MPYKIKKVLIKKGETKMLKKLVSMKNFVAVTEEELTAVNGGCGKSSSGPVNVVTGQGMPSGKGGKSGNKSGSKSGSESGGCVCPIPDSQPTNGCPGYNDYIGYEMGNKDPSHNK